MQAKLPKNDTTTNNSTITIRPAHALCNGLSVPFLPFLVKISHHEISSDMALFLKTERHFTHIPNIPCPDIGTPF